MLLEKIKTPGLSHLSYLIGSQGKAAVIDPRRDCEIYLERARAEGLEITHIFETHRNEDLITGSPVLAKMTGARVLHGPSPADEIVFADTAREGDAFEIGVAVSVLEPSRYRRWLWCKLWRIRQDNRAEILDLPMIAHLISIKFQLMSERC